MNNQIFVNNDYVVASGFINTDRNWNIRFDKYEKLIYIFDSKQILGIDGLFYYDQNDTCSYIITTGTGIHNSTVYSHIQQSGANYYLKGYFDSKTIKTININDILNRAGQYYVDFELETTTSAITFFKNIAPMVNIGAKISYNSIAKDIKNISEGIKDCYATLEEYKKSPYAHEFLVDDKIVRLLSSDDMAELNEISNISILDEEYNTLQSIEKLIDQYVDVLNKNKKLFDALRNNKKTICGFTFYIDGQYIKIKYKNLLKCRPSKYYYGNSPINLIYRILKINNKVDKFTSEFKKLLLNTI